MIPYRQQTELSQKAKLALNQFDDVVFTVLILSDKALFPYEITEILGLPAKTHPKEVSHTTVRDALFRLLDKGKVKRGAENYLGQKPWVAV
ncbi:MAG: hypothetical protein OXU36_18360 [Candidatus Poribacteria bacterium]|nr:hypothetical protein [Candidatus Poribacteria bacterium]MYA71408.1 hypothetical protein [Candidatus Poribacteria bacterium]MYH79540.1 hypothetical protein [Candidatus Poribacteria bacterium]MYK94575.1 hypothetical protein [Candidatus Poribacteria bacterium]